MLSVPKHSKKSAILFSTASWGSIANHLRQHLTYTLPRYQEISVLKLSRSASLQHEEELAILADTHFNLEEKEIDGRILLILEVGSLESLMSAAREMSP